MIVGISSFTYGWGVGLEGYRPQNPVDENQLVQRALQFGLRCLQMGDNLPVHEFDDQRKARFREILQKNHFRIELGARGMTEENLKNYIDLSAYFNAPLLRFVVDGPDYFPSPDTIILILRNALPELKKNGLALGIENHDRFKSRSLAKIIESVGSEHVGICLDCANSIGAGEGIGYVAEILGPYTINLHFKEFTAIRLPHKMGFTICGERLGYGLLEPDSLMQEILKHNRCQSAILEQWVPPEDNLEASIEKEKLWAEEGIAYLKKLKYFQ